MFIPRPSRKSLEDSLASELKKRKVNQDWLNKTQEQLERINKKIKKTQELLNELKQTRRFLVTGAKVVSLQTWHEVDKRIGENEVHLLCLEQDTLGYKEDLELARSLVEANDQFIKDTKKNWLNTERCCNSMDPNDRLQNDPDYVNLKKFDYSLKIS